ncbi:MAG: tyrosine--tRNA ligase [Candidatus Eutrophobiaceae bacterium]
MSNNFIKCEIEDLLRGAEEILPVGELEKKLAESRPLKVKVGFDPTAPDLHLGHTVLINKMRQFQDAGHEVIFLIGDFTAMIGDPSGKSATRPNLEREQIEANARTYKDQVFRILDAQRTRVEFNSVWMDKLGATGLIRLASHYTVARMLERDDFQKRYAGGVAISVHEFLYPLVQGYDSIILKADVELGGTDQKFNLLVGRHLQEIWEQRPQTVFTMPILQGYTHGAEKMSKSLNNCIGVSEPASEMYGKLMSIDDEKMWSYWNLLSLRPTVEIKGLLAAVADGMNPRDAKMQLALEIAARFHGTAAAACAERDFVQRFQARQLPEEVPKVMVRVDASGIPLPNLLKEAGLVSSASEGRRMIRQGGVRIGGERVEDTDLVLQPDGAPLIQVGKRRIAQVKLQRDSHNT